MVQYLYAKDTTGTLVDISDVSSANRIKYYCPSCGMEMSAVLGEKIEHHFRHKGNSCSYESYLHKISKLLLKWRFDNYPTFEIAFNATQGCHKMKCPLRNATCNDKKILRKIDLKEHYDLCEIEGSYNGFRADLKLSNSNNPEALPLFLEVAVSHKCSFEKVSSGIPIIEISVINERDALQPLIESPTSERTTYKTDYFNMSQPCEEKIKFFNFDRNIYPERQLSRFFVYKGDFGIKGVIEPNIGKCYNMIGIHNENALFEIQFHDLGNYATIWRYWMYKSADKGINLKDCRTCQYYYTCKVSGKINIRDKKPLDLRRALISNLIKKRLIDPVYMANQCYRFKMDARYRYQVFKSMKNIKYYLSKDI